MDWDESEDSSSSPRTAESADLPSRPGPQKQRQLSNWDLPPLRHANMLELFDSSQDFASKFSFTGESDATSFGFDTFQGYEAPGSFEHDSYGLVEDVHASQLASQGNAFDQIGMSEDLAPPLFHPASNTAHNGMIAPAWDEHIADASFIHPSDLLGLQGQAHAAVPEMPDFTSMDATQSMAPPANGVVLPEPIAGAKLSAGPAPKLKKRTKEVALPPLARSNSDLSGQLGLFILGLKADPQSDADRAYHSRVETSLRLNLVLAGTSAAASRAESDIDPFGSIPDYADTNGALKPELLDDLHRVGSYRYIKLDKSSPVFKRDHFEPPPHETLYLESHIYFASHPDQVVPLKHHETKCSARATKGCIPREMKRWHERVNGNRRSQTDSKEELLSGLEVEEAENIFDEWIESAEAMMFNDAEVQDFSEGCTSVQLRILHYARCFADERQQGYFIVFTLRNHLGQVLAQSTTPSIFMTDNHKGSSAKTSAQHSPIESGLDDLSVGSSRGSGRNSAARRSVGRTSRAVRRTSSTDSRESGSSRSKRAAEPATSEAKRRKSSGFASRSSLSMTPRDPTWSGIASPIQMHDELSAPASPGALHAELARMPQARREGTPSTEASSSALSPPLSGTNDVLAGLHRAEQQAPLVPPQRSRTSRPRIEDVIPTEGSVRGGGRIAVIGSGFRQGAVVYFGLTPSQTEFRGSTSLVCTLPPAPSAGPVHVNFGTDSTEDPNFTYIDDAEQVLTTQSVSVVAAMLGLTSLDLSQRFEELRRNGQVAQNGSAPAASPLTHRGAGLQMTRSRRASIGESSGESPSRSPQIKAHGRTKSLTDLSDLNVAPPPPKRRSSAVKATSTEQLLVSLFDLPNRRMPPHLFAEAVIKASTAEGQNVVHLSAMLGYNRLLQMLLARGAPLDVVDANSMTALHFAALHARIEVIHTLLEAGAPSQRRNAEGLTAYKIAEHVIDREDVMDAFPLAARSRSITSSQASLLSYFASGSDFSEDVIEDSEEEDDIEDELDDDEVEPEIATRVITPPKRTVSQRSSLSAHNLRSHDPLSAMQQTVKSDDEDTLVDTASVATARPRKGSKWFSIDTESVFWSPISTAWWQPRGAMPADEMIEKEPPAPRMYGPSEATVLQEKVAGKTAKSQAAMSRRLDYGPGQASPPASLEVDMAFHRIQKHRSVWHDRKLFLFWIPALLLAMAYFLHSASLFPFTLEVLLPRALLDMR